jgi:NAD(P)-dependent dehydrogenase (short-subunit alcohol dehydrogenase family)
MTFRDKTVIVTGGGSGVGRETALRFARDGAVVHVVDVVNAEGTAAEDAGDGKLIAHTLDATDAAGWADLVAGLTDGGGRIDVLAVVHAVLSRQVDTVTEQSPDEWNRVLTINLTGAWLSMRAVLPTMTAQGGGAIVLVSSGAAVGGINGLAAYSSSKGGLISLVRQASVEYARAGVRINGIAPGIVDTPMLGPMPPEFLSAIEAQTPMGRLGRAAEIAAGIRFLASDEASFITGQVLGVDGGLLSQAVAPV